uniref:Guanylate cyclase activator 1Ab.2 n=1 Tax=Salmo trutta TaxID=8032 RepID=A0A673Y3J4_SALTR
MLGNNSGVSIEGLRTCEYRQCYRKFITECPSGQLTFCEFKQLFGLKNLSEASKAYIIHPLQRHHTHVLQDGFIDFMEYVAALCLVLKEGILRFLVSVYRFHIIVFVPQGLMFMFVCVCVPGELSLEEFMEGIQNDEKLLETLSESLDLIHHQQDPVHNRNGLEAHLVCL